MILKENIVKQLLEEIHSQMNEYPEAETLEIDREFWHSIEYYFLSMPGNVMLWQTIDNTRIKTYRGLNVLLKDWALDVV